MRSGRWFRLVAPLCVAVWVLLFQWTITTVSADDVGVSTVNIDTAPDDASSNVDDQDTHPHHRKQLSPHHHWLVSYLESLPKSLLTPYSAQTAIQTAFTHDEREALFSDFNDHDLHTLQNMVQSFEAQAKHHMWREINSVSVEQPFVFFHQRKAGGSSLRDSLHEASQLLGLPSYLICYDKVPCDLYSIPSTKPYALYGGHLQVRNLLLLLLLWLFVLLFS
jgi:hypothetical protein